MDGLQKTQIKQLRSDGLSYGEIAKRVNVSRDAVISFCRRNGLQEIKKPMKEPSATDGCRKCGKPLVQIDGMKSRVFCSKDCRVKWWKEHPEQLNRKAVYQFACAHCGKPFSAYSNSKRKYCSHSCYISDRFGGGSDE